MTDEELREAFTSLLAALRETNASIKQTNICLAYTDGEVLANRERTRRLEESFQILADLSRSTDARLDAVFGQQKAAELRAEAAERRAEAMERRAELMEARQEQAAAQQERMNERQNKSDEALASLSRTVERYINARNTNGNKPE